LPTAATQDLGQEVTSERPEDKFPVTACRDLRLAIAEKPYDKLLISPPFALRPWCSPRQWSGSFMREFAKSSSIKSKRESTEKRAFDAQTFLDSAGVSRKVKEFKRAEGIYAQGEAASSVMYLQSGGVKLTVINEVGKEAVVAILGPGDFFGEGCLAGQSVRMGTATAVTPTTVLVIEKSEMFKVLHAEHGLSDLFIKFMLARNIRIEEDLIDQLFNSSEKRLARTLLLLARYGREDQPHGVLPKMSQETLAEMIGTTRSRVNFFMNKFRKLGFIKYNGGLQINTSLLSVVLHE
jgi:CRP/FNR family transcriptional regulator, cyclic AMP receptor protein